MRERLDHTGKLRQYRLNQLQTAVKVSHVNYVHVSREISPGS